jgi:hypothetical protein
VRTWSTAMTIAVIAAANLILGFFLFTIHSPARAASDELSSLPELPPSIQQLLVDAGQGNHGEPFTLALADNDLTAAARYFLASDPSLPFARARVSTTGTSAVLDGVTRGTGLALPVRIKTTVGATDGVPWARAEDISLGNTGLPQFVRDEIVRQINASIDFSRYDLLVRIDSINLAQGSITIRGAIK